MTIKYKATFADGDVINRVSKSNREYTHCWRVKRERVIDGVVRDKSCFHGFVGRRELANAHNPAPHEKNWAGHGWSPASFEVVEAIKI